MGSNINELPNEVLLHILSLLPTKDAVRTSVLSTRWRYLFASISQFDIDFWGFKTADRVGVLNFVDRMFHYRDRSPMDKFRLCYLDAVDPLRLEGWILAAMQRGVRELDLYNYGLYQLLLPASLFTCNTLAVLKLNMRTEPGLEVPAEVFLPNLKVLHLANVISFLNVDSSERLFLNCPILEDLVVQSYYEWDDYKCKIHVSSPTLKRLTMEFMCVLGGFSSYDVVINAPNLVYLKYVGCEVNSHAFVNVQSLTEAYIDFEEFLGYSSHYLHSATDVMKGISNIQTLHISGETLVDLQAARVPIPLLQNMTILRIFRCDETYGLKGLPYFLTYCDALETLVLEEPPCKWNPDTWYLLEASGDNCLLLRLKAIEIFSFEGDEDCMKMVEYFLKSARVLENLTIHISAENEKRLKITKELMILPRVSEKCQVMIV
ncbi:hypothetical protein SLE2022_341160 [Rubroshorea leprosula]